MRIGKGHPRCAFVRQFGSAAGAAAFTAPATAEARGQRAGWSTRGTTAFLLPPQDRELATLLYE